MTELVALLGVLVLSWLSGFLTGRQYQTDKDTASTPQPPSIYGQAVYDEIRREIDRLKL